MTPARIRLLLQLRIAGIMLIGLGLRRAAYTPLEFGLLPIANGASYSMFFGSYFDQFVWWAAALSLAPWIASTGAVGVGAYLLFRDSRRLVRVSAEPSA